MGCTSSGPNENRVDGYRLSVVLVLARSAPPPGVDPATLPTLGRATFPTCPVDAVPFNTTAAAEEGGAADDELSAGASRPFETKNKNKNNVGGRLLDSAQLRRPRHMWAFNWHACGEASDANLPAVTYTCRAAAGCGGGQRSPPSLTRVWWFLAVVVVVRPWWGSCWPCSSAAAAARPASITASSSPRISPRAAAGRRPPARRRSTATWLVDEGSASPSRTTTTLSR